MSTNRDMTTWAVSDSGMKGALCVRVCVYVRVQRLRDFIVGEEEIYTTGRRTDVRWNRESKYAYVSVPLTMVPRCGCKKNGMAYLGRGARWITRCNVHFIFHCTLVCNTCGAKHSGL
jgi:hypothetical protein